MARWLDRVFLAELPAWQLLALAAVVGVLWAASLFDWGFVVGRDAFWQFPMGIDMQVVIAAYYYFIQSPWQLPLFYVPGLGAPIGTDVIFTDVVPTMALAGKLIHSATGAMVNPYGAFLFLCFALPGVMMALVLIAARTRCAFAAIIGAIFADTMPALLWRWGDIALEAQFLLIGALALYLFSLRKRRRHGLAACWIGYLALSYLTNIYLFAMVTVIWLCAIIQRRLDRLAATREALATGAVSVIALTVLISLSGQFGVGGGLPFAEFGHYSMNLLSPVVPQASGVFSRIPSGVFSRMQGIIDATGGQYEGFNYFGLGLVLATIFALRAEVSWLRRNVRRHTALLIACAALTAFAVSHRVFFGQWLLVTLPMPSALNSALGIFRSSGRFFWLIGYAQIALVVVLAFRHRPPGLVLYLLAAVLLQLADVGLLRGRVVASIAAGAGAAEFDPNKVSRLITAASRVEVVPSFQCSTDLKQISANMQLMLAAARADVPTNTVYLARQSYGLSWGDVLHSPSLIAALLEERRSRYCKREIEQARNAGDPSEILVLLSDQPRQQQLAPGIACSRLSWARYCKSGVNDRAD